MPNGLALLALLTALFYGLQAAGLYRLLRREQAVPRWLPLLALLPAALQAVLIHQLIDTPVGQNLHLVNIACLVSWFIVLLLMLPGRQLATPLLILFMPIAALLSLLAPWFTAAPIRPLQGEWASLVHIFSALLAYSLMLVAAAQALVLWWLEKRLKAAPMSLKSWLPPLQLQESFLFRLLSAGFVLMTIAIAIASFTTTAAPHASPPKIVLSLSSWLVFAALLLGRWRYGWRGRLAVRWTLAGFALLALAYVGTRFLFDYLLVR